MPVHPLRTFLTLITITAACGWLSTAAANDWPQWQGPDRNAVSKETGLLQAMAEGRSAAGVEGEGARQGDGRHRRQPRPHLHDRRRRQRDGLALRLQRVGRQAPVEREDRRRRQSRKHLQAVRPASHSDGRRRSDLHPRPAGRPRLLQPKGKEVWRVNYVKDFGGIKPVWGFSESPLVDGDKIICTPGGADAVLMALDKKTGKPIWKARFPKAPPATGVSWENRGRPTHRPSRSTSKGVRQYVQLTATTLVGVAATDGKLLWRYDRASNTHRINCTTPIYRDGIVYAASAYDAGGGAVKLSKGAGGKITAKEVFFSPRMKNHHGGMMIVDDCLYGAAGGNEAAFWSVSTPSRARCCGANARLRKAR